VAAGVASDGTDVTHPHPTKICTGSYTPQRSRSGSLRAASRARACFGQGPDPEQQADCQIYSSFTQAGTAAHQQAVGRGCVYPASVPTLPGQLTAKGLSWKGYMEDMGADPTRESATCGHPGINSRDNTQQATVKDQYAARHNPFVYFSSITGSPACAKRDVNLSTLAGDLKTVATTPNLAYITPNLCHDGHDPLRQWRTRRPDQRRRVPAHLGPADPRVPGLPPGRAARRHLRRIRHPAVRRQRLRR